MDMIKNYFDLTGQVALITGCSTGLGVQMAEALATQGCNIVALARRQSKVDEVAAMLTEKHGVEAMGVACDLTDTYAIMMAIDKVLERFGKIDILINNAGTGAVGLAVNMTDSQFYDEVNIDLFGTFKMARAVVSKAMLPAGYGRIINIASMYGLVGNKFAPCAPYHAAKGGVVNLTRALAAEWAEHGITVNCICPGYFETPLTVSTLESEAFQDYARHMVPMSRYGHEGELNTTAIYLSSQYSTYVNGAIIPVDGGYTCM